jgi:hypothetical protein
MSGHVADPTFLHLYVSDQMSGFHQEIWEVACNAFQQKFYVLLSSLPCCLPNLATIDAYVEIEPLSISPSDKKKEGPPANRRNV